MHPAIELQDVHRTFGARHALDGLTLTLPRGTTTLLVGPNGSGKTTLLRLLATLDAPTSGSLRVLGLDTTRDGPRLRAHLGYLGHGNGLPPELTAREVLTFHARIHEVPDARQAVTAALDTAHLAPRHDVPCGNLSHGERRRLALARSLLHDPDVLLLDEPLQGLDAASRDHALTLLRDVSEGDATLLIATHDPRGIQELAHRRLELRTGRLAASHTQDPPEAPPA